MLRSVLLLLTTTFYYFPAFAESKASLLQRAKLACFPIRQIIPQPSSLAISHIDNRDIEKLLQSAPTQTIKLASKVFQIGERRGYQTSPVVEFLVSKIKSVQERSKLNYSGEMYIYGNVIKSQSKLKVEIYGINFRTSIYNRIGGILPGRPKKINLSFSKFEYGILKGVLERARFDSSIKTVEINALIILNPTVKKILTDLGFRSLSTGESLTNMEIQKEAQSLGLSLDLANFKKP